MVTLNKQEISHTNLKYWFEREKRFFPWREDPTSYGVWVSEVMLQQTRASVVVDYFNRWMSRFPTIKSLAEAGLEEVIKAWEGLGYYSRARNLHAGAQYLVAHHGGELPEDPEALAKVKGLGPYTIGAILSFAFHKKAAAVDGNVMRVLSRLFTYEGEIDRPASQKWMREKVEEFLPDSEPWVIMEALIELGATHCGRKPNCEGCPLKEDCRGYLLGRAEEFPKKRKAKAITLLTRWVPVLVYQEEFLLQKNGQGKVMGDLYEFPYFSEEEESLSFYPKKLKMGDLKEVVHTFTRYRARLIPSLWKAEEKTEIEGYIWVSSQQLSELPFSAGHRKIAKEAYEDSTHRRF
jgi:A/G-specific adenine glycosylase